MDVARLSALSTFSGLPDSELAAVAGIASERELEADQYLMAEGDFGHSLFVIESGSADIVIGDRIVDQVGPGDVIGEMAVMFSGRRVASVQATSPTRVLSLFKRDVWRLDRDAPQAAERLRAALEEHRAARDADRTDATP
jgi:CRP-like cAMP-binding protein